MTRRLLPFLVLACAAVFVVGTIGPPLWGDGVFHGTDLLAERFPWKADTPENLETYRYGPISDTVDGTMPARREFSTRMRDGEIALWNPYIVGGAPLGATPTGGVWSPINLPFIVLPIDWAPAVAKLLEMATAIGFTFLFLRRLALGRGASLLGGVIFAGSGFLVMWNNWPQPQVAALIPALFWATERGLQERTLRSMIPLALATGTILIGGFPAVVAYGFTVLGPYVLVRLATSRPDAPSQAATDSPRTLAWWTGRLPSALRLGGAVLAGVALSAFLMLPFASQLGETELDYRDQGPGSNLPLEVLPTLVSASAAGWSVDGLWLVPGNQVESIAYVGAAAVALALTGMALRPSSRVPRGVRTFFALATVLVIAFTFVDGPHLGWLQKLPIYDTNYIGRMRSVLGFLVAVLAALGFDAAWRSHLATADADEAEEADGTQGELVAAAVSGSPWPRRVASLAVYAAGGVVLLLATWKLLELVRPLGERRYVLGELAWPVAIGAVTLVAVAVARLVPRPGARWALAVVPLLVVAQGLGVTRPLFPRAPEERFYPVTATHEFLSDNLGAERYAANGNTMFTGANTFYRQRSVTGHTFHAPTWADLLETVDPLVFSQSPTRTLLEGTPEVMTSPILDRMATRFFVLSPVTAPPGTVVPVNTAVSTRVVAPGESVTVTTGSQPLRGVTFTLAAPYALADVRAELDLEIVDADGEVQAATQRVLTPGQPAGPFTIGIAAEDLAADGPMTIRLTYDAGAGAIELASDADGQPVVALIVPANDGLRAVYDDGTVVFERLDALPRIRWASTAEVVPDPAARLAMLRDGVEPDTVLLDDGPAESDGRPATVEVVADDPERIEVAVDAEGAGHLVVADALQAGWEATLDGEPVDLVNADHGMVAVAVPAGSHTVALTYQPEGRRAGLALSLAGILSLIAVWVVGGRWRSAAWNPVPERAAGSMAGRSRPGTPSEPDPPATA